MCVRDRVCESVCPHDIVRVSGCVWEILRVPERLRVHVSVCDLCAFVSVCVCVFLCICVISLPESA